MRAFMLGWEFPPFVAGGLGTACFGLTRSLVARGVDITFVLPRRIEGMGRTHVRLLTPGVVDASKPRSATQQTPGRFVVRTIDAPLASPYPSGSAAGVAAQGSAGPERGQISFLDQPSGFGADPVYEPDTVAQARRYAAMCVELIRDEPFDLIHAHDWPTFPAAIAISALTGKPWIAHVHSTEFDRAGDRADHRLYDIERHGMHEAHRVITVSSFTKAVCIERYGVNAAKIEVVYNGADLAEADRPAASHHHHRPTDNGEKLVLFLGRLTEQKGPEHFIEAARKVLEKVDAVRFVMAGAGDLSRQVVEMAARSGMGHKFSFTGFLRGDDVDRVFDMADVYVMPSVSEPFGIAPLEAINHEVPVIISRQSGVSEVLRHALKVDYWNTDDLADKIIAVLRHPPLGEVLRRNALVEVQELTWDGAAERCQAVYRHALAAIAH